MKKDALILVVIDIQEKLLPAIFNKESVVKNTRTLIHLADLFGLPVVLTEQYPKGLGHTVPEIKEAYDSVSVPKAFFEKMTFSCARNSEFSSYLSERHKEGYTQILLTGIEAHICVYQTAMDLLHLGYKVFVASDAVGSRKEDNYRDILDYFRIKGVEVLPTETIVFQLLERAGTEEFKKMLPFLK
jgi:nicotinamidase-related amidase